MKLAIRVVSDIIFVAAILTLGACVAAEQDAPSDRDKLRNAISAPIVPRTAEEERQAAIARVMMDPRTAPEIKSELMRQSEKHYEFFAMPDGSIMRADPQTGGVERVYTQIPQ